jgi:uncharacterized protein (UPF0332 family)
MTAEQAALLRKAQDSLRAAKLLADQGFYDFAISRAYYTMFYVAEAFLLGEGVAYSRHSGVIAGFGQLFAKTGRVPTEFHRYLIEGESSRNIGDYDISSELSQAEAAEQIARAARFLELAEHLIGPTGPSVQQE